jgi:hypothetical protein
MKAYFHVLLATTAFGTTLALSAPAAHAIPILSFSQSGQGDTVTGTRTLGATTIDAVNVPISIGQIAASPTPSLTGLVFNLSLASTSAATVVGGNIIEHFSGTFGITGNGHNYLSGSLVDLAFGQNTSFVLSASTPPSGAVTFTSDYITTLGLDRGASFSFADVSPGLSITNGSINSFVSSVSGTFSANTPSVTVPEPASLAVLGIGLLGLAVAYRRRHA